MNKPSLLSLLLVGIVVLGMSCKSQKSGANKLSNSQDFYLSMAKTPCFGKCPIYVITLDASGALTLNAKRFMSLEGQFTSLLDIVQLDSISSKLKEIEWENLDEEYMTGYADLPSTELTYSNTPGDTTFVRWEAQKAPRELISLASKLESIQQTTDWTSANLK